MTNPACIERIKNATNLPEVVAEYTELKRSGSHWIGKCCFHKERTPSMMVHESHFKCFGCGVGGDAIEFLKRVDGVTFTTALRDLSDRTGVTLDSKRISRVALAYAREEAALCKWWWERRRSLVMEQGRSALADPEADMLWLACLARLREHIDSIPTAEKFAAFRSGVTEGDRAEWRAEAEAVRRVGEMVVEGIGT